MIETIEVDLPHGIRLSCRVAGSANAPLLVLLHGFPEAAFVWDNVVMRLADRFRCVAPNLRGYGPSSAPTPLQAYRPTHLVEDIDALISASGGPACAVIAHDWGGALAWNLAAQRAHCLQRLMIINAPHPATFLRELQRSPAQQAASAYMNFLVRPDAAQLLAENDFARLWRFFESIGSGGTPDWLDAPMRERYRDVWRRGLEGPLNYYRASPLRPPTATDQSLMTLSLPASMLTVRVPTRVVWGEADRALLPGLLDGLQAYVAELEIVRLPAAGHWLVHEDPERLATSITDFVTPR